MQSDAVGRSFQSLDADFDAATNAIAVIAAVDLRGNRFFDLLDQFAFAITVTAQWRCLFPGWRDRWGRQRRSPHPAWCAYRALNVVHQFRFESFRMVRK